MDDEMAIYLPARAPLDQRQARPVPKPLFALPFRCSRGAWLRKMRRFCWLLAIVTPCGVVLGSSTPYLKLGPPALIFKPKPLLNRQLLLALGPLPTGKESTNTTVHEVTATGLPPSPEVRVETPTELLSFTNALGNSNEDASPIAGLQTPFESSPMPVDPIFPQSLLRYLCAPGQNGTNQPSRIIMQMYFNPPLPPAPFSSSATYTNGKQ